MWGLVFTLTFVRVARGFGTVLYPTLARSSVGCPDSLFGAAKKTCDFKLFSFWVGNQWIKSSWIYYLEDVFFRAPSCQSSRDWIITSPIYRTRSFKRLFIGVCWRFQSQWLPWLVSGVLKTLCLPPFLPYSPHIPVVTFLPLYYLFLSFPPKKTKQKSKNA